MGMDCKADGGIGQKKRDQNQGTITVGQFVGWDWWSNRPEKRKGEHLEGHGKAALHKKKPGSMGG